MVYLGPEFRREHLSQLLTSIDAEMEMEGVQRLALAHKLFMGSPYEDGRFEGLRNCLYSLKRRMALKEVMVVPDDERGALVDRWYYGKT